jgi:hypothetical protein
MCLYISTPSVRLRRDKFTLPSPLRFHEEVWGPGGSTYLHAFLILSVDSREWYASSIINAYKIWVGKPEERDLSMGVIVLSWDQVPGEGGRLPAGVWAHISLKFPELFFSMAFLESRSSWSSREGATVLALSSSTRFALLSAGPAPWFHHARTLHVASWSREFLMI